jgi:hypothetical protein
LLRSICLHHLVVIHVVSCAFCLACVSLSDDHSDQRLFIIMLSLWKYVDVSILVNKTVHKIIPYCSLFVLWMLQKPANSSFLQFQYKIYFIVITIVSQLCMLITRRYLVTNLNNGSSLASENTSVRFELK